MPTLKQERNPFSDGASKVLRTALSMPLRLWGVRELARLSGTSPALTVLVLQRLERLGYVSREPNAQARILAPERLLRDWAAWYAIKPLKEWRFSMLALSNLKTVLNTLAKNRGQLPGLWALTSLAGASLAAPHVQFQEVHIHLPKADVLRPSWQKTLGLLPDKIGPIHLIQPYYFASGVYGFREIRRLPVVSDIQLYLDCYRYPVRGKEQAEHILSRLSKDWHYEG